MWAMAALYDNAKAAKWCQSRGIVIERAQGESINSTGGVFVPPELANAIIALRELNGVFRAAAQVLPMSRDVTTIPRRTGGLTAVFTDEGSASTESSMAFDSVTLVARKLTAYNKFSSELDEDAAVDLGEFIAAEAAYAFATKEDACGFTGDGTSTYDRIKGLTVQLIDGTHGAGAVNAASGHDTFAEIDATDLSNLIAKLPGYALQGAAWLCSQFAYSTVFCRLAISSGGIVVLPVNGVPMPHFLGFPVYQTQVMPAVGTSLTSQVMILFGNLRLAATLGERRGITVARSELGPSNFDTDQVLWKATERIDINIHDLGDGTTAGPIIGLVGN
jgi:HK97 family phage major capsid protein